MSEERVTILRMLSEGKITVEETEKLLAALGQSVGEDRAYGGAGRRGRMRDGGPIGELIGEIGHEVRRAVAQSRRARWDMLCAEKLTRRCTACREWMWDAWSIR